MTLAACGESEKYIDHFSVSSTVDSFNVAAVFSQNYEIEGEASVAFKNYGSIFIGPNADQFFTIELSLNYAVFFDGELIPVTTLPTGMRFPSIVTTTLYSVVLKDDPGQWKIIGYFARQNNPAQVAKTLVGIAIQIGEIGTTFPTATLTQNYFNDAHKQVASFTVYGPKLDSNNKVLVPGGIFFISDLKAFGADNLSSSNINVVAGSQLEIAGPAAKNLKSNHDRRALVADFVRELEAAGIIRKRSSSK